jgi:hypothetical protein
MACAFLWLSLCAPIGKTMIELNTASNNHQHQDDDSDLLEYVTDTLFEKVTANIGFPEVGTRYRRTGQYLHVTMTFNMFTYLGHLLARVH